MRSIYRAVYIMTTGYLAFMISFPILESGGIDRYSIDDAFFVLLWLVGLGLLFTKKYKNLGLLFTFGPVLFILISLFA